MRRFFIGCAAAGLLLAGGAVASSTVVEATTAPAAPAAVHPVVGAWQLTVAEFPDDPPSLGRLPRRRHLPGVRRRRHHRHRVVGRDRAELGQPHVHGVRPQRRRLRRDADDPRHGRGERGRPDLDRPVHGRVHRRRLPHRPIRPRPRDRHAHQRRADGHTGRFPGRPLAQFGGPPGTAGTESAGTAPAGTDRWATPPAGTEPAGTEPMGTTAGTEPMAARTSGATTSLTQSPTRRRRPRRRRPRRARSPGRSAPRP